MSTARRNYIAAGLVVAVLAVAFLVWRGLASGDTTTLRVWQTEVDPRAVAVLEEIARDFERANPGVRVEIESISWGALSSKLVTALAGGNPPDVAHVQPFMVSSLVARDQLEPLDALFARLDEDDIYPAVRDLQMFDGRRYGLGYAVGITYFAYRRDVARELGLEIPVTWEQYLDFVRRLRERGGTDGTILLPGGDPFFIDQLAVELLSANGGRLFDSDNRPRFTSPEFLQMLRFFAEMAELAPEDWLHERYIDQFRHFATGTGLTVPVTYARAARQIDADAADSINDPVHFAVMPQPVGPSGTQSYATLDAEPWVVFKDSENSELAQAFLEFFYRRDNYLRFCRAVPIHLTPVFRSLAESSDYTDDEFIQKWRPWQDQLLQFMRDGRVRPIFMSEDADRTRPFLLELQGSRIISDTVFAVAREGQEVDVAARAAQTRAEELIERLGHRRW